jgi:hypothetical protein
MCFEKNPGVSLPEGWGSLLAFVFAFAGSYGGSFIQRTSAGRDQREHFPLTGSTTGEGDNRRMP